MNAVAVTALQDVQALPDHRGITLDEVGIADLRVPVRIGSRDGSSQATVATFELAVEVPATVKGTHMSRFVESLLTVDEPITPPVLVALADTIRDRLGSRQAVTRMRFPYFLTREAPVSGLAAPLDYEGSFSVLLNGSCTLEVGVRAPVTSLCPCSKEISDYGAHNQRGYVEATVQCAPEDPIWLEDLVDIAEQAASAPVYALLKRIDERRVTMDAYEKPAFVEDIARDTAGALGADARALAYTVRVTNLESIHSHNAVATVRGRRA